MDPGQIAGQYSIAQTVIARKLEKEWRIRVSFSMHVYGLSLSWVPTPEHLMLADPENNNLLGWVPRQLYYIKLLDWVHVLAFSFMFFVI